MDASKHRGGSRPLHLSIRPALALLALAFLSAGAVLAGLSGVSSASPLNTDLGSTAGQSEEGSTEGQSGEDGQGKRPTLKITGTSVAKGVVIAGPTCAGTPIPGTWTPVATVVTARSRTGLAYFPPNGNFYMLGGETTAGARNIAFEEYDPGSNTWTFRATPVVGVSNSGAGTVGDFIYLPGGYDGVTGITMTQRYDPIANVVGVVSPMPAGNFAHAVAVQGGKMFVLGGSQTGFVGTTNEIFDTATGLWTSGAPVPVPVRYSAAASDGTYVYLIGGFTDASADMNDVQRYDPASNTWSAMAPMLTPRGGLGAFFDGSRIWAVGGGWTSYLTSTEYYDIGANTWTAGPNLNTGRRTLGAAFGNYTALTAAGWTGTYSAAAEELTFTPPPCPTPTVCPIAFSDVPFGSTFFTFIRCLACRQIINGYPDGSFKPNNNVTRGQLSKIVSNSAGFNDPQTDQMFEDVPPGSTFFDFVGRLASRGYISGYACGGVGEPCVPPENRPYFRSNSNATRGQISKIVSNAAGFNEPVSGQTFEDVALGSTFYDFIERLATRGVMGGYPCGNPEPCVPPENRPYFRPNNNATRGQTSKIVANTFFPGCETPSRR